jgi:hypothetical protein
MRTVHRGDALLWLKERGELEGCSLVTSLPDVSEFPDTDLEKWKAWFRDAAEAVLRSTPESGVAIFYQTDLKREGIWVDKSQLLHDAAARTGHALLWRKVVCRVKPGEIAFGRPAYSHLLCYSRGVRAEIARSTPDVIPDAGATTWTRGMGIEACRVACEFILRNTETRTVVDPFCGHGTVLAVAESLGLQAIGVELGGKRARKAERLRLEDLSRHGH